MPDPQVFGTVLWGLDLVNLELGLRLPPPHQPERG